MTLTDEYQYLGRSNAVTDQNGRYSYYILLYAKTSADVTTGHHTVNAKLRLVSTVGNTFYGYATSGNIAIAGTIATEWSHEHIPGSAWDISDITEGGVNYPKGVDLKEGTLEIDVGYGKAKDIVIAGSWTFVSGSAGYLPALRVAAEVAATVTLDQIAGASQPSVSVASAEFGQPITINTNRIEGTFLTHSISYQFGSTEGTIASLVDDSCIWRPELSLASQIPMATSGTALIFCKTYANGVCIGTKQTSVVLTVPETVLPTVSATWEDPSGAYALLNTLVQNYSSLSVSVLGTGAYGSSVVSASVKLNGKAYSGGILTDAGDAVLEVSVTDSRGRVGAASYPIAVTAYTVPSFTLSASRCTSDGNADDTGDHAKITVEGYVAPLNGRNSSQLSLTFGGNTEAVSLSTGNISYQKLVYADPNEIMQISAQLSDLFVSTNREMSLSTGYATLDLLAGGRGISFGKAATREGFDCAMPAYFSSGVYRAYDDGSIDEKSVFDRVDDLEAGKPLSDGLDMNTLVTPATWYGRTGGNYRNCPVDTDFSLEVIPVGADGRMMHRLTTGGPALPIIYTRFYVSGEWLGWSPAVFESGWQTATLTSDFKQYKIEPVPVYRRSGSVVQVRGVLSPARTITNADDWVTITTLPEGYRPADVNVECVQQGGGSSLWFLRVTTGGTVQFARYQTGGAYADVASGVRLSMNVSFLVPSEPGSCTSVDDINAAVSEALASMEAKATESIDAVTEQTQALLNEADAAMTAMAELVDQAAPAIINTVSGTALSVTDAAIGRKMQNLRLFGASRQSGTPTPTSHKVIVSQTTPIAVDFSQKGFSLSPIGGKMLGIPMLSSCQSHNFTDANGQKWLTDEIDLARGVYIQRCFLLTFDGTENWFLDGNNYWFHIASGVGSSDVPEMLNFWATTYTAEAGYQCYHLCSHFQSVPRNKRANLTVNSFTGAKGATLQFWWNEPGSLDSWKAYLAAQAAAGTPLTVVLGMKTPVETPLKALLPTLDSNTISVTNTPTSGGPANMEMTYIADTKIYIDQKLAAISAAMLNN